MNDQHPSYTPEVRRVFDAAYDAAHTRNTEAGIHAGLNAVFHYLDTIPPEAVADSDESFELGKVEGYDEAKREQHPSGLNRNELIEALHTMGAGSLMPEPLRQKVLEEWADNLIERFPVRPAPNAELLRSEFVRVLSSPDHEGGANMYWVGSATRKPTDQAYVVAEKLADRLLEILGASK